MFFSGGGIHSGMPVWYMLDIVFVAIRRAEEAARLADEASKSKSTFLANMSHEIRTPIGVIIGMNEMIQRESSQENIIDYSKDVNSSANTLLSIINDILDFSKIESGKMTIVETEYQTESLIKDILEIAKIRKEDKGLEFEAKIDKNLPIKLHGDEIRIKECLINLVTNAFKYTDKGKIEFEVSGVRNKNVERITFSVTDTGRGIREEEKGLLLESFVRLDEIANKGIQGTGLGLSITSKLLNLMNSRLEIESEYLKGSKFYFTIDQRIVDDTTIESAKRSNELKENPKESLVAFTSGNSQILVVDDNKINLKVFCALLKQSLIKIDTALSGQEAIDILRNKHYDMVFMDHMMPNMDGEETFEILKKENILGDTPIIMLTANAIVGMKEHFLEIGFNDFLTKPIDYASLEGVLRKYLPE